MEWRKQTKDLCNGRFKQRDAKKQRIFNWWGRAWAKRRRRTKGLYYNGVTQKRKGKWIDLLKVCCLFESHNKTRVYLFAGLIRESHQKHLSKFVLSQLLELLHLLELLNLHFNILNIISYWGELSNIATEFFRIATKKVASFCLFIHTIILRVDFSNISFAYDSF